MNAKVTQLLKDILVEEIEDCEIRKRALEILMDERTQVTRLSACGKSFFLSESDTRELSYLITTEGKIPAIKFFRRVTDANLKEAKDSVENFASNSQLTFFF